MKIFVALIGLVLYSGTSAVLAQERTRILVLHVDTLESASQRDAFELTTELAKAINRVGGYDVVVKSPGEVAEVFEEHGRRTPVIVDETSMWELGTWFAARYVIGGVLGKSPDKRHAITLEMVDVPGGRMASAALLTVRDFTPRLLMNRLAQLLLWARLRIICERIACETTLDGKLLKEEMMDPDYNVWLVEPDKRHILETRAEQENYTTYKEEFILDVAELRVVRPVLKRRIGILDVKTTPEAKVYLNDEVVGTTPLQKEMQAGKYKIMLAAGRHDDVQKKIVISPEETTFVSEVLPVNYSSYRRNGIMSAVAAALCIGGGMYASSQAKKAYDQYLETMSVSEMRDHRDKAKTLDIVSYVSYGAAGAFAVWSALEWIGLASSPEPTNARAEQEDSHRMDFSFSSKGLTLTIHL